MTDLAPYYSVVRSVAIYGSGLATAFGVLTAGESSEVVSGVDHIIAGSKEIMVGVGMLMPVGMGIWGVMTHIVSDKAKLAAVNAMPDVVKVSVRATATNGVAAAAADPDLPKIVLEPTFASAVAASTARPRT